MDNIIPYEYCLFLNQRMYYDLTSLLLQVFKKILFIYSWETHRERQRYRQREKQAPCREHDVGLDPGTPESHPEPKADTQPLSHPGVLNLNFVQIHWTGKTVIIDC